MSAPVLQDPNQAVIVRFLLVCFAAVALVVSANPKAPFATLSALLFVPSLVAVAFALLRGEVFNGETLNNWDQALAYFALSVLVQALADPERVRQLSQPPAGPG